MRRILIPIFAAILVAGCAGESAEPLALDPASGGTGAGGSSTAVGTEDAATAIDPASPIVRPTTPQNPGGTTDGSAANGGSGPQRPGDVMPSDPVLPGVATPPTIGAFCDDHLEPARAILEDAEESGTIAPPDRATVQSILDTALDHCTPGEYFAFQQELFAFVDPATASTTPAPAAESELVG